MGVSASPAQLGRPRHGLSPAAEAANPVHALGRSTLQRELDRPSNVFVCLRSIRIGCIQSLGRLTCQREAASSSQGGATNKRQGHISGPKIGAGNGWNGRPPGGVKSLRQGAETGPGRHPSVREIGNRG